MGTFKARLGVSDGNGGPVQTVEAMVDTGAAYTILPESLLREHVGIRPKRYETFGFADGREKSLGVGEARFMAEGRDAVSPVVFGADGIYLLGAVSLQSLGLIPDTTHHKLIPAPPFMINRI
jgi:predicted aspartyl protease